MHENTVEGENRSWNTLEKRATTGFECKKCDHNWHCRVELCDNN
jgi:hypothetical protein